MARPKNASHRVALLAAATQIFAREGLGASTASIAKAADVSTGTLFVHFESKAALVNELFVTLQSQVGQAAVLDISDDLSPREQLQLMWNNWIAWSTAHPEQHRALAHLSVAEEITADSREAVSREYAGIAHLVRTITASGSLAAAPVSFVVALASALAEATINELIRDPQLSHARRDLGFEATWRALTG